MISPGAMAYEANNIKGVVGMNKDLCLNLLLDDEITDTIENLYCKLDKERYSEGSHMGSNWGWTIILDNEGIVDYTYGSLNSIREDVYKGDAIEVAFLTDDAEVSTDDMGDVEDVEDFEDFKKYLEKEYPFEGNEDEKEDYLYENTTWMNYYEFNEENFHKIENEAWEEMSENYSFDKICDILCDLVDEIDYEIDEYERYNN